MTGVAFGASGTIGTAVTNALKAGTSCDQATDEQWASSFQSKAMGQINVVRACFHLSLITDRSRSCLAF
jgi:hypothetical protein